MYRVNDIESFGNKKYKCIVVNKWDEFTNWYLFRNIKKNGKFGSYTVSFNDCDPISSRKYNVDRKY